MFNVGATQLPPTATDLAKAFDILEERLFSLPVQMITKDPWAVDAGLLDHLAWESSVEAWDPEWSDEVKRNVIAVSAEIHRYKGTPYAIRKALMAFGVDADLVEWWEPGGSGVSGTFTARVFVTETLEGADDFFVSESVVHAMRAVLNGVSPVSRGWSLQLGVRTVVPTYIGVYLTIHIKAVADYRIDPPPVIVVAASIAVVPFTQIKTIVIAA